MDSQSKISRRGFLGAVAVLGTAGLAGCAVEPYAASYRRAADRPVGQLPARGEFVVRNAYVLTMDPALGNFSRGDVHVRDGEILAVGVGLAAPGAEAIDARNMIALPGLIETHWHMWGTLARNMAGDEPKSGYFSLSRWLAVPFTPEDNARGVRLALAEALHSGITTVHNWSHGLATPAYADAELRVHQEVGLRARFSYGYSRSSVGGEPINLADVARVQREWFARPNDGLLTLGIASRGPDTHPIEVCRLEWETARSLGLPITTHMAITPDRTKGIRVLASVGLLGPDVQLIHAVHISPQDIELLATTGTHVSLSPYTELRTGFGLPLISELLAAGVLTSLSIDTPILCGHADMFATMRGIQNIANGRKQSEYALPARRVLELGTINGARDLGLADRVGSLTPGKRADLILVRTTDLNMAPFTDPVRMIVQSAQPANVDTVVVDGRILKRAGQLVALDTERVVREAAETLTRVRAQAGGP